MPDGLWERERELRALDEALDGATRGAGRLVIVKGPAGIGKSQLLGAARTGARERGLVVLSARGLEFERDVPFGLVRQLFVPALLRCSDAERSRLFDGPAAMAGPVLAGSTSAAAPIGEGQAGAFVEGLYWLAVNLVSSRSGDDVQPVLVLIVDDSQWADRSSLRFLLHTINALEQVAVCVVLAVRTGEVEAPTDLLARLGRHPGSIRLTPAVLSPPTVASMVREAGFAQAHPDFCAACAHASGGNPFLLVELLALLVSDGVDGTATAAQRVSALLPESVLQAVLIHLGRLPDPAATLASAVAVLDQAPLPLAAAVAGLELPEAEDAADVLVQAQLLAPGEPLCFIHPLLAAAVRGDMRPPARSRTHRRAADLLAAEGAEVGRVAGHLLQARPAADPWVAATLRAAGRAALRNGEPDSAVRSLRRAMEEPPPAEERSATLVELAHAEAAADSPVASRRLTEALAHLGDRHRRSDAYHQLARLRFFKGDISGAADAAEAGLAELDPAEPMFRQLLSAYLTAATFDSQLRPTLGQRLGPYLEQARQGQVPSDPLICAHLGARMAVAGDDATLVAPVIQRALAEHPLVDEGAHGVVLAFPIVSLVMIDHLDRADEALAAAINSPFARRSVMTITVTQHWSAVTAFRRGRLVEARAHAQRALAACASDDWILYDPWIRANLALTLLELGDRGEAERVLADAQGADPVGRCLMLEAEARTAAAADRHQRAYDLFTEAGRSLDAMGLVNPGFISWRTPAALAAERLGRHEDAARLVDADIAEARRVGTLRSIGVALYGAAALAPPKSAVALLEESIDTLQETAGTLELARSLAALGSALRRAGRSSSARDPLRRALDIATEAGAEPLALRAVEELRATGSKPRRPRRTGLDSLTPTERRIADLVARQRTNSQIAHDLYVTTKTVEWHLSNAFHKLNVSSRQQLTAQLRSEERSRSI
jgi:DNA-binding CsgD family transcriptional regulator